MPRTPLEPFLHLKQLQISSAEKIRLKNVWKLCPPPFQNPMPLRSNESDRCSLGPY